MSHTAGASLNLPLVMSAASEISVPCPVCDRKFRSEVIEDHVNKCIFLNTQTKSSTKRNITHLDPLTSPQEKRVKISNSKVVRLFYVVTYLKIVYLSRVDHGGMKVNFGHCGSRVCSTQLRLRFSEGLCGCFGLIYIDREGSFVKSPMSKYVFYYLYVALAPRRFILIALLATHM